MTAAHVMTPNTADSSHCVQESPGPWQTKRSKRARKGTSGENGLSSHSQAVAVFLVGAAQCLPLPLQLTWFT